MYVIPTVTREQVEKKMETLADTAHAVMERDGFHAAILFMYKGKTMAMAPLPWRTAEEKARYLNLANGLILDMRPDLGVYVSEIWAVEQDGPREATEDLKGDIEDHMEQGGSLETFPGRIEALAIVGRAPGITVLHLYPFTRDGEKIVWGEPSKPGPRDGYLEDNMFPAFDQLMLDGSSQVSA